MGRIMDEMDPMDPMDRGAVGSCLEDVVLREVRCCGCRCVIPYSLSDEYSLLLSEWLAE